MYAEFLILQKICVYLTLFFVVQFIDQHEPCDPQNAAVFSFGIVNCVNTFENCKDKAQSVVMAKRSNQWQVFEGYVPGAECPNHYQLLYHGDEMVCTCLDFHFVDAASCQRR